MVENCGVEVDQETMKPHLTLKIDIEAVQDLIAEHGEGVAGRELALTLAAMIYDVLEKG